jgi:hypothetical protein
VGHPHGGIGTVVGPAQAEAFVAKYQVDIGNIFAPRTVALGADTVAYTWDLTRRDGSVVTDMDFNVLREGKVVDNWTFAGPWRDARADGPGPGSLTAEELRDLVLANLDQRGAAPTPVGGCRSGPANRRVPLGRSRRRARRD